jgi:hypothetical protein
LPLDGIAFFILLFFLDIKTPRTPIIQGLKAIDWLGSILVVGGTLMLLFGLQYGGVSAPWDSAEVLCLIIIGAFTLFLFGMWEWKFAESPIMPIDLFASVTRAATLAVVFLHGFVFISSSYYLPLYFQAIRGSSPIISGVLLLPTAVALACTSVATGVFIAKLGIFLPPIYFGFFLLTVGFGLFIDFDAHSSLTKIIIFQVIAGLGVGPMFQSPIIALQAHINPRDIGTATATLGFVRQLATAISVVIGEVVYQNQMQKKKAALTASLGAEVAERVTGGGAGANTRYIEQLPEEQRDVVRVAFADSLQPMWIMYTCFAAAGFLVMFFIKRKQLTREHQETKTGLEAERENAEARAHEKEEKRLSRAMFKADKRASKATVRASRTSIGGSRPVSQATTAVPWGEGGRTSGFDEIPGVPAMPADLESTAEQRNFRSYTPAGAQESHPRLSN